MPMTRHESRRLVRSREARDHVGWRGLEGKVFQRAAVQDESSDGIGLEIAGANPPGPLDPLRILSSRSSLNRRALVVWAQRIGPGRTRVGCRWQDTAAYDKREIERISHGNILQRRSGSCD